MITVVLADDHPFVLRGIRGLLESERDIQVLAAVATGDEALSAILSLGPDVAVLDMSMPGMTGVGVLKALQERKHTGTRAILLTASATDAMIFDALAAGIWGLNLKDDAPDQLLQSIRAVACGRTCLAADLVTPAIERETKRRASASCLPPALTPREEEIALLVAKGRSNKEIAKQLGLSDGTVKVHLHNVYEKLGLPNRAALAVLAHSL